MNDVILSILIAVLLLIAVYGMFFAIVKIRNWLKK